MGKKDRQTIVLDTGALLAFERAEPRVRALVREALRTGCRLIVPAGVIGEVWHDGVRQELLAGLLRGPTTSVVPLDSLLAQAAGILCERTGTTDVIDASVALTARRENAVVVTSDVESIARLDPTLKVHPI